MRNTFSIVAIVGITIAVLAIIGAITLSIFFLDKTHPLYFEDSYGNPVDGDVYLNGEHIAKTLKGKVFIKEFTTGEMRIIAYKDGKSYENYFDINPSDRDAEITFQVEYLHQINEPIREDNYSEYMNAIVVDNAELRKEATDAAKKCNSGDKECQLVSVYEHLLSEYKYFSDARDNEHIQTPVETKQFKGGDCEDLSILLNSLLENIGIETYMVFTEDHAYSLACDIDSSILYNYTLALFYQDEVIENSTQELNLESGEAWYYGGDNTFEGNAFSIIGSIKSNEPITIFAVDNKEEFRAFMDDEEYSVIEGTYHENIRKKTFEMTVPDYGGLVIYNPNYKDASINLDIEAHVYYLGINESALKITTYTLNGKTCVPLDPSAGEFSYAGYEADDAQNKTFVNTLTREEYGSN